MNPIDKKDQTREALVIAAMELFATEGFDAVSLRQIVAKAGAKNASAVAYHFGDRNALLEGIADYIGEYFGKEVDASLNNIEARAQDEPLEVSDVIRALVYPYMIMVSTNSWGPHALQFWSRALAFAKFSASSEAMQQLNGYLKRFVRLLQVCLPDQDEQRLRMRLLFGMTNVSHGIAELETVRELNMLDLRDAKNELWLEEFVNYISGGIAKPS